MTPSEFFGLAPGSRRASTAPEILPSNLETSAQCLHKSSTSFCAAAMVAEHAQCEVGPVQATAAAQREATPHLCDRLVFARRDHLARIQRKHSDGVAFLQQLAREIALDLCITLIAAVGDPNLLHPLLLSRLLLRVVEGLAFFWLHWFFHDAQLPHGRVGIGGNLHKLNLLLCSNVDCLSAGHQAKRLAVDTDESQMWDSQRRRSGSQAAQAHLQQRSSRQAQSRNT